jgi:hypothetical protein
MADLTPPQREAVLAFVEGQRIANAAPKPR